MPKGFLDDRLDVLLAMYGYFTTSEKGAHVNPQDLKVGARLLLSSSHVAILLESLLNEKLVSADIDNEDENIYTFTEEGMIAAEREIISRGQTLDQFLVDFKDKSNSGILVNLNHPEIINARRVIADLKEHLRTDNDIGSLTPEDRAIAFDEVSELQVTLSRSTGRTHYVWSKANEVLMWLIEKGAGSVVGELAKQALSHIHSFINVFFN